MNASMDTFMHKGIHKYMRRYIYENTIYKCMHTYTYTYVDNGTISLQPLSCASRVGLGKNLLEGCGVDADDTGGSFDNGANET